MQRACPILLLLLLMLATPSSLLAGRLPSGVRVHAAIEPSTAAPGTTVELSITLVLPAGWIAFDLDQVRNSAQPTRIVIDSAAEYVLLDDFLAPPALERPEPLYDHRIIRYFDSSPTFRRMLVLMPNQPTGRREISGRIDFQLCDVSTGRWYLIRNCPLRAPVMIVDDRPKSFSGLVSSPAPVPSLSVPPCEDEEHAHASVSMAPALDPQATDPHLQAQNSKPEVWNSPSSTDREIATPTVVLEGFCIAVDPDSSALQSTFVPDRQNDSPAETSMLAIAFFSVSDKWWLVIAPLFIGLLVLKRHSNFCAS